MAAWLPILLLTLADQQAGVAAWRPNLDGLHFGGGLGLDPVIGQHRLSTSLSHITSPEQN